MNDEKGASPFPGNINQLIVSLGEYKAQLEKTGGQIEEFVNPKYADDTKTKFKSPTRLECMMQDYPKALGPDAKGTYFPITTFRLPDCPYETDTFFFISVGFTVFDNWVGYSPVKNSPEDGVGKFKGNNPTHTATSGEMEVYGCGARLLELAGASIAAAVDFAANDIVVPSGPRVVLHPSFACTFDEIKGKVHGKNVKLTSPTSVLVVEGSGVTLESLTLDGALVIKACAGANVTVKGLTVANKGWTYAPVTAGTEIDTLRGFVVEKTETETLVFDKPGNYTVP